MSGEAVLILITCLLKLTDNVSQQARQAITNRANCIKMAALVKSIEPSLLLLQENSRIEQFQKPLELVEVALEECLRVVCVAGRMGNVLRFIKAGTIRRDFEEASRQLSLALQGFGFAHNVASALEKETFIDESTKEEHGIRVELQQIVSKIYNKAITAPEGWELIRNQLQNVLEDGVSVECDQDHRTVIDILKEDIGRASHCKEDCSDTFLDHVLIALSGPEKAPPREFLCPISLVIMDDPVIIASGETFDKKCIEEWLLTRDNSTCPTTQMPLQAKTLIPNRALKSLIDNWKRDHGYPSQCISESAWLPEGPRSLERDHDKLPSKKQQSQYMKAARDGRDHELLHTLNNKHLNFELNECGITVLHTAAAEGRTETVYSLIKRGADINRKSHKGDTPLHLAAKNGRLFTMMTLIENGANVDARTEMKKTPLHYAAREGHLPCVRELCARGANIDAQGSDGNTALHRACFKGQRDMVELLVRYGADKEARNQERETPLFLATEALNEGIVEFLIDEGANVNCETRDGKTLVHLLRCRSSRLGLIALHRNSWRTIINKIKGVSKGTEVDYDGLIGKQGS